MAQRRHASALASFAIAFGCSSSTPEPERAETPPPAPAARLDRVSRPAFNARAVQLALPLFWSEDKNEDGALDPDELAVLFWTGEGRWSDWLSAGAFTPKLREAYELITRTSTAAMNAEGLDEAEAERRRLVMKELSQGRPTLVHHDLTGRSAEEREMLKHVLAAAQRAEKLYMIQNGSWKLRDRVPKDDPASRAMFYRNQGPWCEAPATQSEAACNAIPDRPKPIVDVYPESLQSEGFCEQLQKKIPPEDFDDHFSKIEERGDKLVGVKYHEAYKDEMEPIAAELEAAADALKSPGEEAFIAYLRAAAKAFRDSSWSEADKAWVAMNSQNSKWFLRIGPDESYWEPCAIRAGFHSTFALIDPSSLEWRQKIDPVKIEMEKEIAKLAGAPYKAREVSFSLPDFIDIVLNAGDARSASGATVGQSLPNWGPVADNARTVAMTSFYTDPDSKRIFAEQAASLLCSSTMGSYVTDPSAQIMSTVLHEAAHNLGPAHEYKVGGKTDDQLFGGPLAATMEELKAQSAALFLTDWMAQKGIIDEKQAAQAHVRDLTWAFGHISRGMYTGDGQPKTYGQLAMMQLGFLVKEKAIAWREKETAANGVDTGCFEVDLAKFPGAAKKLMGQVAGVKAKGDKKRAEALKKDFVDAKGEMERMRAVIAERVLRHPKASFVYSIRLEP
jgi:hypothetical protein